MRFFWNKRAPVPTNLVSRKAWNCTDQRVLQTFLLCLKRNASQTLKSKQLQKRFSQVQILWVQLASINIFCFTWSREDNLFYANSSIPRVLVQPPYYCGLWNKRFKISPHFISIISIMLLQWCKYQRSKIKLLLCKCF